MCAIKNNRSGQKGVLRIEPVDHWHDAWEPVLRSIERHGEKLKVDNEGWLSPRQVVMVAFVGAEPAAHISFSVSPGKAACIEATLDSFGIDPQFCGRGIESQLHRATMELAARLRCKTLRGFRMNSTWC